MNELYRLLLLLFFDTSEYKMDNIKYYYVIFSRTIKKTKCVLHIILLFFFFFFYRGKNHLKIIFISIQTRLRAFFVHFSLRGTIIQIIQ